jgi:hypothetical protein
MRSRPRWSHVVIALGVIAALTIASPVFGLGKGIKKAIRKESRSSSRRQPALPGRPAPPGRPEPRGRTRASFRMDSTVARADASSMTRMASRA